MARSRLITILVALALGACAATPKYAPANDAGDIGHFSRKIDDDRYRVVYNGGRGLDLETTRNYALLRAAEVTLAEGYDWFEVVHRETSSASTEAPRSGFDSGFGYERAYRVETNCGLLGCSRSVRPSSYGRMEIGTSRPDSRHSHALEIVMGKGEPPADQSDCYDADRVVESLRETI